MKRMSRSTERILKAKTTNPAPMAITLVVGIVTPDVGVWVGEEEEVVGEWEVEDDIAVMRRSVIREGGRSGVSYAAQ